MDPDAVRSRAQTWEFESPLAETGFRAAAEGRWVAEDPETGCRGFGEFEEEARLNLVRAVRAAGRDPDADAAYLSTGPDDTYRMRWRDERPTLLERLRGLLPRNR